MGNNVTKLMCVAFCDMLLHIGLGAEWALLAVQPHIPPKSNYTFHLFGVSLIREAVFELNTGPEFLGLFNDYAPFSMHNTYFKNLENSSPALMS